MPCDAEHARTLSRQYVCSLHFSETDFTVGDKTRLERLGVPTSFTVAPHSNSAQHHGGPSSNSSKRIPSCPDPHKNIFQEIQNPVKIHSDTTLPSFISPDMSVPAETSTFSKEDTPFPLVSANESASGEEFRSVHLQSPSPKCKVRHSLIKDLGLDSGKTNSTLCKLRKKYKEYEGGLSVGQ